MKNKNLFSIDLELGKTYLIRNRVGKFIKVTRKGFNFLDEATNCCILMKHTYAKGMGGMEIPRDQLVFKCYLPDWFEGQIHQIKENPKNPKKH